MIKIGQLPLATKLPGDDEYVLPICIDNTTSAVHSISIKAMADRIIELALKGNEVEMIITEHGIKFNKQEDLQMPDKDNLIPLEGNNNKSELRDNLRIVQQDLTAIIESMTINAKITRAKYDALIAEKFTEDQAIELSKKI